MIMNRLADTSKLSTGFNFSTCVGRHLGDAAMLLKMPEQAQAYYLDALETAQKMRFRPEIALTRFQLAKLQLEHFPDERHEALEHLKFAIK